MMTVLLSIMAFGCALGAVISTHAADDYELAAFYWMCGFIVYAIIDITITHRLAKVQSQLRAYLEKDVNTTKTTNL